MHDDRFQGGRNIGVELADRGRVLGNMLVHNRENVFAIMNQHVSQDPPSIRQFNPNISAPLETVVMHAIRRDADKRYQSMRAMLDDLTHLDTVAPVPYTPESPRANALNRQLILGLAITGILLLIAIAIGILAEIAHNAAH